MMIHSEVQQQQQHAKGKHQQQHAGQQVVPGQVQPGREHHYSREAMAEATLIGVVAFMVAVVALLVMVRMVRLAFTGNQHRKAASYDTGRSA